MTVETQSDLNTETISTLQELIQINTDSSVGFDFVAKKLNHAMLSDAFRKIAEERRQLADELSVVVASHSAHPNREGSYAAALHRCWTSCREMVSSNDLYALLAEAKRGEDVIKQAYESALKETLAPAINDTLHRQFEQVRMTHDRVRDLRDAVKMQS